MPSFQKFNTQHEKHLQSSLKTFNSLLEHQTSSIYHLAQQYKYSQFSQQQLVNSLNILNRTLLKGGKIVVSGVGKSHKIAAKIVATMNSLSIYAALLHPSEALHGDLGIVRSDHHDCLIFISSSGKSPELLQLLPHISNETPIVLLTNSKNSLLSNHFQINSLLYAELPDDLKEESVYGLNAPSISTTLCLTLADAVVIALAELYITDYNERKKIFGQRHPGGAIGESYNNSLLYSNSNSLSNSLSSSTTSINPNLTPALHLVNSNGTEDDVEDYSKNLPKVIFDLGSDNGLDANDIQYYDLDESLAEKVTNYKNVGYLDSFFHDEAEILTAIALYEEYIVFKGIFVIEITKLKEVFKHVHNHNYNDSAEKFIELSWRIKKNLVRIK
ncbi:hypothetical protein WICMUC_002037 [Wickerhamomyces mucosus]|uniref:SIS domain-containing protein n=1 Tax=Wickerhamomyces mucosus TaxID=1378264 RepID=A0A9P8PQK5_9ASCO|nr:hypothetical protein WICMUC_002037 [Wickerhamomyces mucosus]